MNRLAVMANAVYFLFLCVFFFCPESAHASQYYDDIVVSVESSPSGASFHGYAEYRISLTNNSVDKDHKITLFAPSQSYGQGDHVRRMTRSIALSPSSTASVSILQPPMRVTGDGLGVIIDGATQRDHVRLDTSQHCRYSYRTGARGPLCILLSRSVSIDDFQNGIYKAFPDSSGRSAYNSLWNFSKSESPTTAWSNNWLAYSRYDGIVLTASDIQTMPASVNSAILQYVRCGGSLLVLGQWDKPASWKTREKGLGPFRISYIHFGICAVTENSDVTAWKNRTWKKLVAEVWGPTGMEVQRRATVSNANREFPVIENLTTPVKGMFALVLIFAITIGPANLLILSRKNKRIWMLWTVPAVSIVTCTAVFLYAFLAEGWKGHLRAQSITILDENTHSATTIGINAFYCPLTPRGGLHFDYETEITPMGFEEWQGGRGRTIDWTNDQHLASGWVAARVPAHFLLRKTQMRRERLKITRTPDNGIDALNGFGADIQQLWYADKAGRIYKAENIAAGAKATLTPSDNFVPSAVRGDIWRKTYSSSWARGANQVTLTPGKYLSANCYIAVLDDLMFVEQALENLESKNSQSVVFGILKGSADAG